MYEKIKAVLIGIQLPGMTTEAMQSSLNELKRLADTAEIETLGKHIQKKKKMDSGYCAGTGFLDNIIHDPEYQELDLLIFENELTSSQSRNISKKFEVEVIDRTEVILSIFHNHARTNEAMLQIKLAQMEYQLPRLKRLWDHLDRERGQAGGTGGTSRGMGEKQIEVDKRKIRLEIHKIKSQLNKIEKQKETQRIRRMDLRKICLVGYTNAGKSTLFNRLTNAGVLVEDKLFATLDSTTRKLELSKGRNAVISDTVGFISNLPHHLVASFRATLMEVEGADLLLHTIDCSDPDYLFYIEEVNDVLKQIGAENVPQILVLNKLDKIDPEKLKYYLKTHTNSIAVSASNGFNMERLLEEIDLRLHTSKAYKLMIPFSDQKMIHKLHNLGEVIAEAHTEKGTEIDAIINKEDLKIFENYLL